MDKVRAREREENGVFAIENVANQGDAGGGVRYSNWCECTRQTSSTVGFGLLRQEDQMD